MEELLENEISHKRSLPDVQNEHDSKRFQPNTYKKSVDWKIEAILGDEYRTNLNSENFRNAFAFSLKDKKKISALVRDLDKFFPLDESDRFIKRVSVNGDIICILISIVQLNSNICSIEDFVVKNKSKLDQMDRGALERSDIFSTKVPLCPPKTRAQFEKAKTLWPCHFHENKSLECTLNGSREDIWSKQSLAKHVRFMEETINICKQMQDAAIVVNPER